MGSKNLKNILLKNKSFVRLRYSPIFIKLWLLVRPAVRDQLKTQSKYYFEFIKNLKPGPHIAFDIGANEGFISEVFLEKELSVVAVEPDTRNITILTRRFQKNPKFHLSSYAAGSRLGKEELYLQRAGSAFSTLSSKWKELIEKGGYRFHFLYEQRPDTVQLITIDELINIHGMPSLIKIDVEGYEAEVMKGLNLKIPFLIFEANLPEFIGETFDCIERLHQIDKDIVFNYSSSFTLGSDRFVGFDDFKQVLQSLDYPCVDIICIMSNYLDYYTHLPTK